MYSSIWLTSSFSRRGSLFHQPRSAASHVGRFVHVWSVRAPYSPRLSVRRSNQPPVPGRRLPVRNDAVVSATGALPSDSFVGPHLVLDDAGARLMPGASPASDRFDRQIKIVRSSRCRSHDPGLIFHEPARGPRDICRKAASLLIDEMTQVGYPGHMLAPRRALRNSPSLDLALRLVGFRVPALSPQRFK